MNINMKKMLLIFHKKDGFLGRSKLKLKKTGIFIYFRLQDLQFKI